MSGRDSSKFHIKTPAELANLPTCRYDSLGTCDELPEKVSGCIRCLMEGMQLALCRENIGSAMNHLKTLQIILEEIGLMKEEEK